ncbi:MAG: iron uptake protein [Polyangiaceae bacterium]
MGALHIVSRVAASLLGSYALVWGFVSLGTVLGVLAGMSYGDAQTLFYLLAFLLYVACICWAFSARSVLRVWLCLAGGGALLTTGAWLIASRLL